MKSKNACNAAHCSLAHFPTIEDMSSLISHQWCSRSLCPAPQEDFENHLAITLGMLRRPLKTLRRATGPIVSCMGAAKAPTWHHAKSCAICSKSLSPAPQEDFKNHLAITLGMLRRPLKTLRRATGPIVSCMGAAKAPKGTKKPALTPGIMRNHVQFAPGA